MLLSEVILRNWGKIHSSSTTVSIHRASPRKVKAKPNHKRQQQIKSGKRLHSEKYSSLLLSVAVTQQGTSMLANQNNFESTTEWLMTLQCTHTSRGHCLLGFRRVPCFLLISQCLSQGIYTNKKIHYFKEQWLGWCCKSRERPLEYKPLASMPRHSSLSCSWLSSCKVHAVTAPGWKERYRTRPKKCEKRECGC